VRALLLGGLVGLCVLVLPGSAAGPPLNPIQLENALPGSPGWHVSEAPEHAIEGYASEVSVAPGGSVDLHVSTAPAAGYRVEFYRLGWYGGVGGRLEACLPASCTDEEVGQARPTPAPDATGYLDAGWPVTDTIPVPPSWLSGYYVAVLRLTSGPSAGKGSWVPFVVRAPDSQQSAILVQAAVNTWQAYNAWGGVSLYHDATGARCKGVCTRVSFNRPYDQAPLSFQGYELPLVHFLEESGYDVSYTTDADTDRDPGELLRHRLVIVAGHDEYWTKRMRDGFETARALGTNLAFMGANTGYWQMRYASLRRTIVEYRIRRLDPEPNPALKTVRFRDLLPPRPECQLEGVEYVRTDVESIGGQHDYSVSADALSDPWFAGTGFTASSVLPGLVGYEWDAVEPGCRTPTLTVLFHYGGPPASADAVRFTAPSGAIVFSAGSLSFAVGLNDYHEHANVPAPGDPRLERFVRNAFADMLRPSAPRSVRISVGPRGITVSVQRRADPRVLGVRIYRAPADQPLARGSRGLHLVCDTLRRSCLDRSAPAARQVRYVVVVRDRWGASVPFVTAPAAR
jgi:N,N-dimethylformamidase beta subunit-like, C-terminal